MPAGYFDMLIEQGATFSLPITYKINEIPVDLTGWEIRFHFRECIGDEELWLNLSTENGGILATPLSGAFTIYATASQTGAIPVQRGVYDVELYTNDATPIVKRLLNGELEVVREVTG